MKEEELKRIFSEKKIEALIISNRNNIRYLSGYCGDTGIYYLSANKKVILTDFRYIYQAQDEAKECEVIDVARDGYAKNIAMLAKAEGVARIGIEADHVLVSSYKAWQKELENIELVPVDAELENLRTIKTEDELSKIRRAEQIGDIVFEEICKIIKPGMTELEIAAHLEFGLKMNGASGNSFDPIVASGVNSALPHAVPTSKPVTEGDFLTMDFGCIYEGYCSDMTRTVVIGKASDRQREIYNVVLQAQEAVLAQVRATMKGMEADTIARDIINKAGFEGCFGHGLGHGVGLNIHEEPRASQKYDGILLPNMTLTVEPGIYIKDFGGVRIEDLVIITENGCENLTHSPKHLIEL